MSPQDRGTVAGCLLLSALSTMIAVIIIVVRLLSAS
jgi:hypothetical protein